MKAMREGGLEASHDRPKTMRPADHPNRRELRRRRDLVWLYLHRRGMSPIQIQWACAFANRSHWQVRQRLRKVADYVQRRLEQGCS
jgi:hypothetical protein